MYNYYLYYIIYTSIIYNMYNVLIYRSNFNLLKIFFMLNLYNNTAHSYFIIYIIIYLNKWYGINIKGYDMIYLDNFLYMQYIVFSKCLFYYYKHEQNFVI